MRRVYHHFGIHPESDGSFFSETSRDLIEVFELFLGLDVDHEYAKCQRLDHLLFSLADPAEDNVAPFESRRLRAIHFAARYDIDTGAERSENSEDCQI